MSSFSRRFPVALLALLIPMGASVRAATRISGTITDPTGAGLPNVAITLTPSDPGQPTQHQTTKKKGQYFFSMVRAGGYRLEAVADGFRVAKVAIHSRDAERKPTFDFEGALQPGSKERQQRQREEQRQRPREPKPGARSECGEGAGHHPHIQCP